MHTLRQPIKDSVKLVVPRVISLEGLVAKVYSNHRMEPTKLSRMVLS